MYQPCRLGRTDLDIAPLVLGGNVFGWTADKSDSFAVLDRFLGAGLNAIDFTAERLFLVGWPGNSGGRIRRRSSANGLKARGNRSRVIVVTKVGSPMGKGEGKASSPAISRRRSKRRSSACRPT